MKGVCNDKKISRGEIYVADLNPYQGSEQGGIRPVVILQNDAGNYFSSTTIVASLTSHVGKKENLPTALQTISNLETEFVSLQSKDDDNTTGKSDRLTIQYTPATSTIFNCEGVQVTNASSKTIVQRYYVAESPQQVTGEPTSYSLYCDAASYDGAGLVGLNTNAQQIMQRVDAFKVRLGVKNPAGQLRYMTIDQYIAAMETIRAACATPIVEDTCSKTYLNVVSMDIGILSRSTGTIGADANLNTQTSFNVAGTPVTLSGDVAVNKRYLRQAVNQVVAIRNTLGASS